MKITKQRLREIIKEELQALSEVDRGEWVVERDGVTSDEKYLTRAYKWGPQDRAAVHEFKQEAQGTLRYALENGKIDSGRVSEVSAIEEWINRSELEDLPEPSGPGWEKPAPEADEETLVLPRLKHDPLGNSPAAEKMRRIARRRSGDN